MRKFFCWSSFFLLVIIVLFSLVDLYALYWLVLWVPYAVLGIYDLLLSKHAVCRNYPVFGHLRFLFEEIRPEIQQYFINTDLSGRPFNREIRTLVYTRGNGEADEMPFGTQQDVYDPGFESARHSLSPTVLDDTCGRIVVGGDHCKKPYHASRYNISAMSFGALSAHAILALNKGAKLGNFFHNTGEGGLSDHHLAGGGDICWQVASGYFGCRTEDGHFNPEMFKEKVAAHAQIKMIEIKLSQGAKPSLGGILPGVKVTAEIARVRGVPEGKDCLSPPVHSAFSSPEGLLQFVQQLRELSGGLPVGFKLCLGVRSEFMGICKAMLKTSILPDFITVDGAEGGTGAAPVEFSDNLGSPINSGVVFVHSCLKGIGVRDKIRIIASGKVATGFDLITKIALGADMCNAARPMLFSVGCIQSRRCNTNTCPTGVATQDKRRMQALDVERKKSHTAKFHNETIQSMLNLAGAMGMSHIDDLAPTHIFRRVSPELAKPLSELYHYLQPNALLEDDSNVDELFREDWKQASAESF